MGGRGGREEARGREEREEGRGGREEEGERSGKGGGGRKEAMSQGGRRREGCREKRSKTSNCCKVLITDEASKVEYLQYCMQGTW